MNQTLPKPHFTSNIPVDPVSKLPPNGYEFEIPFVVFKLR
jgi:hypothetical protein